MTQVNYNRHLKRECADNDLEAVTMLLTTPEINLDLTYGFPNVTPFTSVIKNAYDVKTTEKYRETASKIFSALLDYYKMQNLSGNPKAESYENALHKLCDILVDAHKSYPFTDIVKAIVSEYFKGLVSADITDDMKEIIGWIDEDDGTKSERDESFDDETYGSSDMLDKIHTNADVQQDNELPPTSDIEWPENLLHFRHPIGYTPDQTTE